MSEQEKAWRGEFGTSYQARQSLSLDIRRAMFLKVFGGTVMTLRNVIEFGAGTGGNLEAIGSLWPWLRLLAVEVNEEAIKALADVAHVVYHGSILDDHPVEVCDLVFTRGLLIHIHPDDLAKAYQALYNASAHYILIAEYYSPRPEAVPYRGRQDLLWKRDFAGEMLDRFPDLRLRDYGFVYHRDPLYPQDDITWFLMEKLRWASPTSAPPTQKG